MVHVDEDNIKIQIFWSKFGNTAVDFFFFFLGKRMCLILLLYFAGQSLFLRKAPIFIQKFC